MENTPSLTGPSPYKALEQLHDRAARFVARVDVELLALQLAGAAVLLDVIFAMNAVW